MTINQLNDELTNLQEKLKEEDRRLGERMDRLEEEIRNSSVERREEFLRETQLLRDSLRGEIDVPRFLEATDELKRQLQATQVTWDNEKFALEAALADHKAVVSRAIEAGRMQLLDEIAARCSSLTEDQKTLQTRGEELVGGLKARLDTLVKEFESFRDDAKSFKTIKIKDLVQSVDVSSSRARTATYVLAVTSLIVFSAFWNVHPGGWLKERVKVAREAETFVAAKKQWPLTKKAEEKIHQDLVAALVEDRGLDREGAARNYREQLESLLYKQSYQVKIPFFGVSYDINDLGLLGGFAFFVVLMILRFSLARELANLKLAFREAEKKKELADCYKLLSMGQVLTVPPHTGVSGTYFTKNLPKILYVLPAIIQSFIIYNDISTLDIGLTFSRYNAILAIIFSAGFWIINAILTYNCIGSSLRYDNVWMHYDRVLHRSSQNPHDAAALPSE